MKIALVFLGFCALYLVHATSEQETELEASELQELEDALDLIDETSFESLEDEMEIARKKSRKAGKSGKSSKSGKSNKSGKDKSLLDKAVNIYKKGEKIAQNEKVQQAAKIGLNILSKIVSGGPHPPGTPVGNNKCWALGTTCSNDCDCCPEHHCHCPAKRWTFGLLRCYCHENHDGKANKCPPPAEETPAE
uniref:Tx-3a n=1 Tax=Oxyopes takobius TaxID=666126 RepID=W0LKM7_OXYTA|nr:Tx-3a precursor [Oxyopes takobius]